MAANDPNTYLANLKDDAIVRAVAGGAPNDKICRAYDLTPAALASLKVRRADDIQAVKDKIQLSMQLAEQYMDQLAPKALRNVEMILDNTVHKQHGELSWKVLERALPSQQLTLSGGVGLAMSEETAKALANAFAAAVASRGNTDLPDVENDKHMIDVRQSQ